MIFGDFHAHTKFSDGKNKMEDMVSAAVDKGLKQFGITDHGLRHVAFGLTRKEIPLARQKLEELKIKYPQIKLYYGIETNIYSSSGSIDLRPEDYDNFDYIIAGFHKGVWAKDFIDMFRYNLPGFFCELHYFSKSEIKLYTSTFINAIKHGRVNIISHPCYALPMDIVEVGKAALDYGVLMELNGKKVSMSDQQVLQLQDLGTNFIVNSDAHRCDRVGDFTVPLGVVDRLKLNKDKIVNWDKEVSFIKR
ncbi:MAG: PHP domain-containing protein [Clostridia bacterium]